LVADLGQGVDEESVMPSLGGRVIGGKAEDGEDGLSQVISQLDRMLERRIVAPSLGALHPVEDATSFGIGRPVAADQEARVGVLEWWHRSHEIRNWGGGSMLVVK